MLGILCSEITCFCIYIFSIKDSALSPFCLQSFNDASLESDKLQCIVVLEIMGGSQEVGVYQSVPE